MTDIKEWFYVVFKYGGHWCKVKRSNRNKYEGGKQRTVKMEKEKLCYFGLVQKVKEICPLLGGHDVELHYHIYDTSPKEYKLIQNDIILGELLQIYSQSNRVEIVIINPDDTNHILVPEAEITTQGGESISALQNSEVAVEDHTLAYQHPNYDCIGKFIDEIDMHLMGDCSEGMTLAVGTQFHDAVKFKQFIRSKAILDNFGLKIQASDKKRVIATCTYLGCPWRVRGSVCADGLTFEVRKLIDLHSCPGVNRAGNKHATSTWVAHEIQDVIKKNPDIPPKQINNCLESCCRTNSCYNWKAREASDIRSFS